MLDSGGILLRSTLQGRVHEEVFAGLNPPIFAVFSYTNMFEDFGLCFSFPLPWPLSLRGNAAQCLPHQVGSLRRLIEERRRSSAVSALSESQICLREDAKASEQEEPAGPPDGSPRSGSRRSSVSSEAEARSRPTGGSDPGSEEESFGGVIFKRLTSLARRRTIANRQAHSQPESSGSGGSRGKTLVFVGVCIFQLLVFSFFVPIFSYVC